MNTHGSTRPTKEEHRETKILSKCLVAGKRPSSLALKRKRTRKIFSGKVHLGDSTMIEGHLYFWTWRPNYVKWNGKKSRFYLC